MGRWVDRDDGLIDQASDVPSRVLSALSPSQQPTFLFSIYQNNTWTIRCLVAKSIDPVTQHIILKIFRFHITSAPEVGKGDFREIFEYSH